VHHHFFVTELLSDLYHVRGREAVWYDQVLVLVLEASRFHDLAKHCNQSTGAVCTCSLDFKDIFEGFKLFFEGKGN
jgi:hypothetical protein